MIDLLAMTEKVQLEVIGAIVVIAGLANATINVILAQRQARAMKENTDMTAKTHALVKSVVPEEAQPTETVKRDHHRHK
jgi:hypothetical protein